MEEIMYKVSETLLYMTDRTESKFYIYLLNLQHVEKLRMKLPESVKRKELPWNKLTFTYVSTASYLYTVHCRHQ